MAQYSNESGIRNMVFTTLHNGTTLWSCSCGATNKQYLNWMPSMLTCQCGLEWAKKATIKASASLFERSHNSEDYEIDGSLGYGDNMEVEMDEDDYR